jgi:hypothetical protein
MKFSAAALTAALVATFAHSSEAAAFVPSSKLSTKNSFVNSFVPSIRTFQPLSSQSASSLQMSLTVGIVGATGAVGKEIRQVLEKRGMLPVEKLRIFGSARSAGSTVDTKYGQVEVELFDVTKARECDVVFLAVNGDFSLEHGEAIAAGDDGAVVIDNSVSRSYNECFILNEA